EHGIVALFDKDGTTLAGIPGPGLDAATQALKGWKRGRGGTAVQYMEVESGDEQWDVATRSLSRDPGLEWTAVVAVPDQDFMGNVNANRRTDIGIGVVGILLDAMLLALVGPRRASSSTH